MVKKHLIVASMVLASVCSCLVVGKNVNGVFAQDNKGISSGVIAYEKGDPAWDEIAKKYDMESLNNTPYDELTMDLVDDSDYSKAEVKAYPIGDESFIAPAIDQDAVYDELTMDLVDDSDYSKAEVKAYPIGDESFIAPAIDQNAVIDHLQEVKGNNIPTLYKNLANGAYHYSITNMQSCVYTNYYFNVNSQNMIIMSLDSFNSGGHNITIRCYEVGSNNQVHSWTGNPELYSGIAWPSLNQNKMYYFKFEISGGTLSGSGSIYH